LYRLHKNAPEKSTGIHSLPLGQRRVVLAAICFPRGQTSRLVRARLRHRPSLKGEFSCNRMCSRLEISNHFDVGLHGPFPVAFKSPEFDIGSAWLLVCSRIKMLQRVLLDSRDVKIFFFSGLTLRVEMAGAGVPDALKASVGVPLSTSRVLPSFEVTDKWMPVA
jgi:hypothetical protein